jgi:tetratricopeptide (TPR) repeat protein
MCKTAVRFGFILFLFSFCLFLASSQQKATGYTSLLASYQEAQRYYDQATSLSNASNYGAREEALEAELNKKALAAFFTLYNQIPSGFSSYDSLKFYTTFRVGELQHYFEDFHQAVTFYNKAIAIQEKSTLPDSLLFKPLLYAGIIYYNQNKFDTAITYFKKAETLQTLYHNQLAEAERLYNILGVLLYERGNYKQAKNYFQKALALLSRLNPYYKELFVNYNINLAQLHLRLEEYDKANEIYQQLLPLKLHINEINHNIGSLNLSLGAAAKAISYFRNVSYQNNKIVRLYNSMGEAFFNLRQYDSARSYYQKAIHSSYSFGENADPVGYGLVLKNLGNYYIQLKKSDKALTYYQQAINRFYPAFKDTSIFANPDEFSGVFSYINLFNALLAKAEAWHIIYTANKDIGAAQEEIKVYQSAFKLIAYVERTYESDEARLFLNKIKYAIHDKPIDIAYDLYNQTKDIKYVEALYYFDQQNKAAILSLNRQLNESNANATLPQRQKELSIKTEITRLSLRAAQINDSSQVAQINNTIRDLEISLGKAQEEENEFAKIKGTAIPSISAIQQNFLDNETALISYYLSPNKLTSLIITKKQIKCIQHPLPETFKDSLQGEIMKMKTPSNQPLSDAGAYYSNLLLWGLPLNEIRQLIIIPDDLLSYLPFESLKREDGRYLVESTAIQYQYSTALVEENRIDFSGDKTVAFAPFASHSFTGNFTQLPYSADEISITKGRQLVDSSATKANFLKTSNNYRIMHLATHAIANQDTTNRSYIAFYPDTQDTDYLLYTEEIYNLNLQKTDLVILSACETGAGRFIKGEGILSLSRAFAYAGCPNIITSLWKADDFSTAYLTTQIHHHLQHGSSISSAVQQAKADYLTDKSINPRLKQPYYWAHLVFIGTYSPAESSSWLWIPLAAIASLLLLVFLIKKAWLRQAPLKSDR